MNHLGAAIVRRLHSDGFNIILHYRSSKQQAQKLVEEFNHQRADSAVCFAADLSNNHDVAQLAEQALGYWGRIDTLINNASSFYSKDIGAIGDSDWQQLMDGNVKGAFFLSQALAPSLRKNRGCIINMVDIHAERPLDHYPVYSMAKAAVAMMTKSLAKELAPEVRVNGVSPGAILWPDHEVDDQAKQRILGKIPLQRIGEESDIVKTISFLLESPYITGQIIAVDGGRSLTI
jgi:pteridine reductase